MDSESNISRFVFVRSLRDFTFSKVLQISADLLVHGGGAEPNKLEICHSRDNSTCEI